MALYTYACPDGHESDVMVPVDARNDPRSCPVCEKPAARRITSQFGFRMGKEGILRGVGLKGLTGSVDPYSGDRKQFGYGKSGTYDGPRNFGTGD